MVRSKLDVARQNSLKGIPVTTVVSGTCSPQDSLLFVPSPNPLSRPVVIRRCSVDDSHVPGDCESKKSEYRM